MARHDIRIYRQVEGGIGAMPLTTGQSFLEGEVVVGTAAGTLSEAATNPGTVTGISLASSQGTSATGEAGMLADQVRPDGTLIQFYKPASGQLFVVRCGTGSSSRFATDGAGTAAAATVANVFDIAGFTLTGGNWFLDTGVTNLLVEITHVLDANGAPLGDTSIRTVGDGAFVVFGFL
jgi:hypothetical protein